MRDRFRFLAGGFLLLGLSAPASSATLTLTGSTLSVSIAVLPSIVVGQSPASLGGILVSSGGGSFTVPSGLFATTQAITVFTVTGVPLISALTAVVSNGTAVVTAGGGQNGGVGGAGALAGTAFVNILSLFNLSIPLALVGGGGTTMIVGGASYTA